MQTDNDLSANFHEWVDVDVDGLFIEERQTQLFVRAVTAQGPDAERAERIVSDAAVLADEAARFEHRRRVVAPLLMLLALGLLFAAGWTC